MKIFDFNIHLPILNAESVDLKVGNERELDVDGVLGAFEYYKNEMSHLNGGNLMLFNEQLLEESKRVPEISKGFEKPSMLSLLFDFRQDDYLGQVSLAHDSGIRALKFHSYVQKIDESYFSVILEISKKASELGMALLIDASYGSINMYKYDNLKLACAILAEVKTTPVVILHSGGARVLETMLIADEMKNVYLETSFSIPYYVGSSIESDLAFAYKKLGSDRLLYGSDFPYVSFSDSEKIHLDFFKKYNFSDEDIENIMFNNAMKLVYS